MNGKLGTILFTHQFLYPRDQVRARIRKLFTHSTWMDINTRIQVPITVRIQDKTVIQTALLRGQSNQVSVVIDNIIEALNKYYDN